MTDQSTETGHTWRAVGPNAAELWNQCAACKANEDSTRGRLPCPAPASVASPPGKDA